MSTTSKLLLLLLLTLLLHLFFVTFSAIGLTGGANSFVFPFGSVDYSKMGGFVQIEFYLTMFVLLGFAISLFRSQEEE